MTVDPALYLESPYVILPTDRKPVKPLTHVKLVSQGFATQIHEYVDATGQVWHIGPGYREYMGMTEHPQPTVD